MQDLIASLVGVLVLQPLEAELNGRLEAARAPRAVVEQVARCAKAAAPALAERVTADPWWAVTTTVSVWVGATRPEATLEEVAPACGPAIRAARPFLTGEAA